MPVLTTERTYLRYYTDKDLAHVKAIFCDAEIMNPVGGGGAISEERAEALLKMFLKQYADFGFGPMAVVAKADDQVIGLNGVKQLPDFECPDLGFAFLKSEWRKGYALETSLAVMQYAFTQLKMDSLCAIVHPANLPSVLLLKKLGFSLLRSGQRNSLPIDVYRIASSAPKVR